MTPSRAQSPYFHKNPRFHVEEQLVNSPLESLTQYNVKNHNTLHECSIYIDEATQGSHQDLFTLEALHQLTLTTQRYS